MLFFEENEKKLCEIACDRPPSSKEHQSIGKDAKHAVSILGNDPHLSQQCDNKRTCSRETSLPSIFEYRTASNKGKLHSSQGMGTSPCFGGEIKSSSFSKDSLFRNCSQVDRPTRSLSQPHHSQNQFKRSSEPLIHHSTIDHMQQCYHGSAATSASPQSFYGGRASTPDVFMHDSKGCNDRIFPRKNTDSNLAISSKHNFTTATSAPTQYPFLYSSSTSQTSSDHAHTNCKQHGLNKDDQDVDVLLLLSASERSLHRMQLAEMNLEQGDGKLHQQQISFKMQDASPFNLSPYSTSYLVSQTPVDQQHLLSSCNLADASTDGSHNIPDNGKFNAVSSKKPCVSRHNPHGRSAPANIGHMDKMSDTGRLQSRGSMPWPKTANKEGTLQHTLHQSHSVSWRISSKEFGLSYMFSFVSSTNPSLVIALSINMMQ